ncbi:hypothetical protein Sjap_017810 [Stephania japonica]|uniref:Uncharacterized protein n=1 Tax=Stephania japonica TaxID=461633 RepID=A0AAP0NKW7_9MAGN
MGKKEWNLREKSVEGEEEEAHQLKVERLNQGVQPQDPKTLGISRSREVTATHPHLFTVEGLLIKPPSSPAGRFTQILSVGIGGSTLGPLKDFESPTVRAEKWKHDMFDEANRSPTPKNEDDQIAKIEALLAS